MRRNSRRKRFLWASSGDRDQVRAAERLLRDAAVRNRLHLARRARALAW